MIKEYFKYNQPTSHNQPSHDLPSSSSQNEREENNKNKKKKINFILKPSYGNKGLRKMRWDMRYGSVKKYGRDDMKYEMRFVDW